MWPEELPKITVRRSTEKERKEKWPGIGRRRIRIPKYVVVALDRADEHMWICSVFGLPQGGDTRAETVFWAERFASKNGYSFVRPEGWEKVKGALKDD